jgi:hypothetical protein
MTVRFVFEWLSVFLLFGLGIYTMWVIKNEKKTYLKNAREIEFKKFKLYVPVWWKEALGSAENELCFQRNETPHNWEAKFIWNPLGDKRDLNEVFKEHIANRKILFDEENAIIHNPNQFIDVGLISSGAFEMVRIEGTATEDDQERLYYDAFLIRQKENGTYLYAECRSSILNGLAEGPYFEAVMTRLELVE